MPNSFETLPQENIHLKEYPKEFGNDTGEKMVSKLLETMPGCSLVKESSEYDNQKEGLFDIIMELKNGSRLAIDITDTANPERQEEKIKKIIKKPLVVEHNDKGQVVDDNEMPRVLIKYDISTWGKAYNNFLKGETNDPLEKIDQKEYLTKFRSQIIQCLEAQKYYHPRFNEIYQPILELLKKEKGE